MRNFFRKVAFGLKPEQKIPTDPLTWAQKQVESVPKKSIEDETINQESAE